jgi:hypothetical protein
MRGVTVMKLTMNKIRSGKRWLKGTLLLLIAGGFTFLLRQGLALTAAEICKQNTIMGFVGTKSCVGQDDGGGVVPAAGNLGSVDTLPSMPAAFNTTAPSVDYAKICSSQSLLGSSGTASCAARAALNHIDKSSSTSVLSENFSATAPNGRLVPMIKDDDGESGTNVIKYNRTGLRICGTDAATSTYESKIADCATHNGTSSRWLGSDGNSGHGNWTLVTVADSQGSPDPDGTACNAGGVTCHEIWRDDRTGLLWSDRLPTTLNWCRATGSNLGTICSVSSNQPGTPVSLCAEGSGRNVSNSYDSEKGDFRLNSGAINVRWWVPTRYDWMEAEENGVRFVLPNISAENFWTSSADSSDLTKAWIFKNSGSLGGAFETLSMTNGSTYTRCVGQVVP